MQNIIQKFKQNSIVFKRRGILSENLKTLTSSNYPTVNVFCSYFTHTFYLPISTKGYVEFYLDLQLFAKIKKRSGFYTLIFYTFINNSRSKKNKKVPDNLLLTLLSIKSVQSFSKKKKLSSMVVGAHQSFQFFRQRNLVFWK